MSEQLKYFTFGNGVLSLGGYSLQSFVPNILEQLDRFYPVGTYYSTVSTSFDPNVSFVGTWVRDTDGLVTIGGTDSSITGGEETHVLTTDEMPSHTHTTHRVVYGNYNQDRMTNQWNSMASTGNLDYVYNGNATAKYNGTGGQAHSNVQKSMIGIRWHRIY